MDLRAVLEELMLIPGLAGHEGRVAGAIARHLDRLGLAWRTDRLGNLMATLPGNPARPSVMVFTHMDSLGFIVRKVEPSGLLRLERLGGVPERAMAAQAVLVSTRQGDLAGVIANKSHHATTPEEKYRVVPYAEHYVDCGFPDAASAHAAGVRIGDPVVWHPRVLPLHGSRLAGTTVDDRAGCAVLLDLAARRGDWPTVHLVFSVQEEFNLRGVLPAVRALNPAVALQIDLVLCADTPDMAGRGEVRLGAGPAISLYSFHGRGTLNGLIPHPALVALAERAAEGEGLPLQRSAHTGALTETSYVQLEGVEGVACLDVGFPCRHTHSALEVVDVDDLSALVTLLAAMLARIGPAFPLTRMPQ